MPDPTDARAPYDPSQPLAHDAGDEQIVKRHFVLFKHEGSEFPDPVAVAREYAAACVAHECAAQDTTIALLRRGLLDAQDSILEGITHKLVAKDAEIARLTKQVSDWSVLAASFSNEYDDARREIARLTADLGASCGDLIRMTATCEDLTDRLAATEQDAARLDGKKIPTTVEGGENYLELLLVEAADIFPFGPRLLDAETMVYCTLAAYGGWARRTIPEGVEQNILRDARGLLAALDAARTPTEKEEP